MSKRHAQSGYTLIEMLLVVSIMGLVSGLVFADYHRAGRQGALVMGARQLAAHVRQMENFALNGKEDRCTGSTACSWGVHLSSSGAAAAYYDLFEDYFNVNYIYNANEEYGPVQEFASGVFVQGIRMQNLSGVWSSQANLNIAFLAPDPEIRFCRNSGAGGCDYMAAEITLNNGEENAVVTINNFGLVDVR